MEKREKAASWLDGKEEKAKELLQLQSNLIQLYIYLKSGLIMHLMDIKQFFDIEILRAIMTCKREQEGLQVLVQTKTEDSHKYGNSSRRNKI